MYKSYEVDLPRSKTPEPIFIQDEINNLKKYMKFIQALIKTTPFYPPPYYKSLYSQEELDKQYWNKVAVVFLEKKHNANTTRKGFPIKMYIREPSHKLYFIALTLQGKIIIRSIKKMVTLYVVEDLVLLE